MGDSTRRLRTENEDVVFDFSAPAIRMNKATFSSYSKRQTEDLVDPNTPNVFKVETNPDLAVPRAVRVTIMTVVASAFPPDQRTGQTKMTRKDRQVWAAWMEVLDAVWDEDKIIFTMPRLQVNWVVKFLEDGGLAIDAMMSQWCEALLEYCKQVQPHLQPVAAIVEPQAVDQ